MNIAATIPDFNAPVVDHARKDFPLLRAGMTVGEALDRIRREGVGERVIYFYAIDEQERLMSFVKAELREYELGKTSPMPSAGSPARSVLLPSAAS